MCSSEDGVVENCAVEELYVCSLGMDGTPGCVPLSVVDQTTLDMVSQLDKSHQLPWDHIENEERAGDVGFGLRKLRSDNKVVDQYGQEQNTKPGNGEKLIHKARSLWRSSQNQEEVEKIFNDEIERLHEGSMGSDSKELSVAEALVMGQHALFLWELEEEKKNKKRGSTS